MRSADFILHRVRTALGRNPGETPPEPPPVRLRIPEADLASRIASFTARLEALAGRVIRAASPRDAGAAVRQTIEGKRIVASNVSFLAECGITRLPGVQSGITNRDDLRTLCADADVGITSADFALADTGTLVMLSSPQEARMISLLPPAHIAVVPAARLLTGLDELFTVLPAPASVSSSLVLISGPSRTADIEQILVRGVHGPGQLTVILVGGPSPG